MPPSAEEGRDVVVPEAGAGTERHGGLEKGPVYGHWPRDRRPERAWAPTTAPVVPAAPLQGGSVQFKPRRQSDHGPRHQLVVLRFSAARTSVFSVPLLKDIRRAVQILRSACRCSQSARLKVLSSSRS